MSLMINEECIACDACREECPNDAIEEGDPYYMIDQNVAQNVMVSMMNHRVYRYVPLMRLFQIQIMLKH